jgi:hypothetical protein
MDTSWIILGGVTVVILAILVYVVLMIFLPEWVGITGKAALEAERGHAAEVDTSEGSSPQEPPSGPNRDA